MAAMTTALTEFSDNGDSRTYTYTGHTVLSPKIVIQKRRVPSGNQTVAEDSVNVLVATKDVANVVLPQKVSFSVTVRRPINGTAADVTAALATFRDVIAGDEFAATVNSQGWLKA
jgi:hypothetical protein